MLGGRDVTRVRRASRPARVAEDESVQLQQVLGVPESEQIDPVGDQAVDEGIARQHVVDDHVVQVVAPRAQDVVDAVEASLHASQRRLERVSCVADAPIAEQAPVVTTS